MVSLPSNVTVRYVQKKFLLNFLFFLMDAKKKARYILESLLRHNFLIKHSKMKLFHKKKFDR